MRRTAALIVGGGPAGAACAITLARGGVRPLLLERRRTIDDALCGGFLSWRSLATLAELGIEPGLLSPRRIDRVRLFAAGRMVEAMLPAPALAVSRRRLDTLLLDRAAAVGVAIERGVTVRQIDGRAAQLNSDAIEGDALFLASGKHEVRGAARPADARGADPALGLRVRLPPHTALARLVGDAVELHPFRGGYVGIAMQEDGSVNCCMAVRRSRLAEAGDPAALLRAIGDAAPALGERLGFGAGGRIDAVANVPYGWRTGRTVPGVFRLGDQAGVIPSLAGEGMGIALATGADAARALIAGRAAPDWQRGTAAALARPMALAGLLRALAEAPAGAALLARLPPALLRLGAGATRFAPRSPLVAPAVNA